MAIRKWVRFTVIVDHTSIYDLMEAVEGKALAGTLDIQRVKHGGEDVETGALKEIPTARQFIMAFVIEHPRFRVRDLVHAGAEKFGMKKQSLATACTVMMNEGTLKRVGVGTYEIRSKKAAEKSAAIRKGVPRDGGPTVGDRILEAVRKEQNGSGDGVPLLAIKTALKKTDISPTITDLVRRKALVRTSPGHYRTGE